MSIRKNPHKKGWIADFKINGRRIQLKAATKELVIQKQAEAYKNADTLEPARKRSGDMFTLSQAFDLSYNLRWKHKSCGPNAKGYGMQVLKFFGANHPVQWIAARHIHDMREHFLNTGNKPGTVNWKASTLRCMIVDSHEMGYIKDLPTFPKSLPMDNTKERVFSKEEEKAFVNYFYAIHKPKLAHMFVFLIEQGCRFSEAERMMGREVDIYKKRVIYPKTKNHNARTVPLTEAALNAVAPYMPTISTQRVWGMKYKAWTNQFDRAKGVLGLNTDIDLTTHCTRHTCATRLTAQGVSLVQVMQWGGWKSLQAVQRYAHVDITQLTTVADRMNNLQCGLMLDQDKLQIDDATNMQL
tara:strand:+ start:1386 stop:2450 length:1065 start_codon:yes stop_codon:yes gene_type:complete